MGSQSQRWSCGTLNDGVDQIDLVLQEQDLLQKLQATNFFKSQLKGISLYSYLI